MDVRPGYKLTDVGIIPDKWEVKKLGECLRQRPSYGINAPAVPYSDCLPVYIRITDITEEGRFVTKEKVSVKSELSKNYYLEDGDIVFARTGASVGKSYRYRPADGPLVYAGFLIRVKLEPARLLPEFASAFVTTGTYWRWVRLMSMRSGQPGINGNEYAQLPIPLPSVPEQRAIAGALSDVDALLGALDRLIAKKRLIKQGAMQDLLTAKRRLPGFSGEWDNIRLSEHGKFLSGSGFPLSCQGNKSGDLPFFKVSDFSNADNGSVLTRANHYIDQPVQRKIGARVFPPRAIAFAKIGAAIFLERKRMIAQASCLDNNMAAFILEDEIFSADLILAKFQEFSLGALVSSTALPAISSSDLRTIEFYLPKSLQEQQAISNVLTSIDAEIQALEQRRIKTAALKQGMMQELLTGRTRLV